MPQVGDRCAKHVQNFIDVAALGALKKTICGAWVLQASVHCWSCCVASLCSHTGSPAAAAARAGGQGQWLARAVRQIPHALQDWACIEALAGRTAALVQ